MVENYKYCVIIKALIGKGVVSMAINLSEQKFLTGLILYQL